MKNLEGIRYSMRLQSIIFPGQSSPEEEALYYRSKGEEQSLYYRSQGEVGVSGRKTVLLAPYAKLSFDTYFNSFSTGKWAEYTVIDNLYFRLRCSGKCRLEVFMLHQEMNRFVRTPVISTEILHTEVLPYRLDIPWKPENGIYYIQISALSEAVTVSDMEFCSDTEPDRRIKIGLVTCTCHREAFVKRNAGLLCETIIENGDSELKNNLEILVIDNGQTLHKADFPGRQLRLYPNVNTGGSGGFSRGMIEVQNRRKEGFSHVLLMDDDIRMEPETLERTYSLLCLAKKKYARSFIGGAMLRSDQPYVQEEAGARWKGKLLALGKSLDLRTEEGIYASGQPSGAGHNSDCNAAYNAWWYCCIPLSLIDDKGLPLPFFIHGDDAEYGLRCGQAVLQLNGICVWHDVFENKRSSSLEYYDIRNFLIVNAMYCEDYPVWKEGCHLIKQMSANIMRMRYEDVLLNIEGIQDFLKGPEWWKRQDIQKLNQRIAGKGYQFLPFSLNQVKTPLEIAPRRSKRTDYISCALTLGGLLMPKRKETLVAPCGITPFVYGPYRTAYLVEPESNRAIRVEFSRRKALALCPQIFRSVMVFAVHHKKIGSLYRSQREELSGRGYWDRYLRQIGETG